MAYMPELHSCCVCKKDLGPDNGDGICSDCENTCARCGVFKEDDNVNDMQLCSACAISYQEWFTAPKKVAADCCEHGVATGDWCERCHDEYRQARQDPRNL
jgi:hypothetical protein